MEWLKGTSIEKAPALLGNIRLGWKGLPRTNTPAYYKHLYITAIKSFITLDQHAFDTHLKAAYSICGLISLFFLVQNVIKILFLRLCDLISCSVCP